MKKNVLKFSILFLLAGLFFSACQKEKLLDDENSGKELTEVKDSPDKTTSIEIAEESLNSYNYVRNGKMINASEIDWNNDNLNVFYGFDNTKNAYVFFSEKEMIEWVKTTKHAESVIKVLNNIEKARQYAIKIGEFEQENTSVKFDEYMQQNYGTGEKGLGWFAHDLNQNGHQFGIVPWPKRSLRRKNDNEATSFTYFGNYLKICDGKNWTGSSKWFATPAVFRLDDMRNINFNDKVSSYWT